MRGCRYVITGKTDDLRQRIQAIFFTKYFTVFIKRFVGIGDKLRRSYHMDILCFVKGKIFQSFLFHIVAPDKQVLGGNRKISFWQIVPGEDKGSCRDAEIPGGQDRCGGVKHPLIGTEDKAWTFGLQLMKTFLVVGGFSKRVEVALM